MSQKLLSRMFVSVKSVYYPRLIRFSLFPYRYNIGIGTYGMNYQRFMILFRKLYLLYEDLSLQLDVGIAGSVVPGFAYGF